MTMPPLTPPPLTTPSAKLGEGRKPQGRPRTAPPMPETQAAAPGTKPLLTRQERKVLSLKEEGLSASAIAKRLFVSKRTVNFHCYNAYRKLGVNNAIRAINAARALGLLVDTSALEVRAQ